MTLRQAQGERSSCCAAAVRAERADVLAFLARKAVNAERIAAKSAEHGDDARSQARALRVAIDDLTAGLHEGETEIAATLAEMAR